MTPWDKLLWMQKHALLVSVEVNEHKVYYETAAETLETRDAELFDEDEADLRAECIRRNELVVVQVYPSTPVGFYRVGHYDLDVAVDRAYEATHAELATRSPSNTGDE